MNGTIDAPDGVSVLVTVMFCIAGLYCGIRIVVGFSWIDRTHNAVHLAMSILMALMPWPAYSVVPPALPAAAFTAAALFYLGLLLFHRGDEIDPLQHHASRGLLGYHATMMAGMVWMSLAMSPIDGGGGSVPHDHMSGTHGMTGMTGTGSAAAGAMTGSAGWAIAVSLVAGLFFAVAVVALLGRTVLQAVRAPSLGGRHGIALLDALAAVVMAAGMALAFLVLMT